LKGNNDGILFAFQQPPNVYEIYADPLKGQEVSLAWKQYTGAMAAAGVTRAGNSSTVIARVGHCHLHALPRRRIGLQQDLLARTFRACAGAVRRLAPCPRNRAA